MMPLMTPGSFPPRGMQEYGTGLASTPGHSGKAAVSDQPHCGSLDMGGAPKRFKPGVLPLAHHSQCHTGAAAAAQLNVAGQSYTTQPGVPYMPHQSQYYAGAADIAAQRRAAKLNGAGQPHTTQPGVPHMPHHSQYHAGAADIDAQRTSAGLNGAGQSHAAHRSISPSTGEHQFPPHTYPAYPPDFRSGAREGLNSSNTRFGRERNKPWADCPLRSHAPFFPFLVSLSNTSEVVEAVAVEPEPMSLLTRATTARVQQQHTKPKRQCTGIPFSSLPSSF